VISADDGKNADLLLQNVDRVGSKFQTKGTLTEWQDHVARFCVGNSRLMFAVSAAFAAPLLPISDEPGGGFHLTGTSSTGKTTALLAAGSVWGGRSNKGFLDTWKSTGNGLEAIAEMHNHSLLLLDEINEVNSHEVGHIVYALANGFGKSRMTKAITARRKAEWNLLFLSTGEETLEQKMGPSGQKTRGGQHVRFVNIDADAGAGMGLYETLHGFASPSSLADHLSKMARRYYGIPIREFLRIVCRDRVRVEKKLSELRPIFTSSFTEKSDVSGEVYRAAARFALIAAGGSLAADFGIAPWRASDVIVCVSRMFNEWLSTRGTVSSHDAAQGAWQVLSFISMHGASRFQQLEPTREFGGREDIERIYNRAGFKKQSYDGRTEYIILPEVFDRDACQGYPPLAVARELDRMGCLVRGSERDSLQDKRSLPELGRRRVYVVTVPDDPDLETD
jgi:uncharacterized protein (DUF927 family)